MVARFKRFRAALRQETGQGLPEYALILGLVAVFCMATLQLLGDNIASVLNVIAQTINP